MSKKIKELIYSLLIDAVGMITYIFPALGEVFDVIWAPISALLLYKIYGSVFFSVVNFTEEILPATDVIPTATFAWLNKYYLKII